MIEGKGVVCQESDIDPTFLLISTNYQHVDDDDVDDDDKVDCDDGVDDDDKDN